MNLTLRVFLKPLVGALLCIQLGLSYGQALPPFVDKNEPYQTIGIASFVADVNANNSNLKIKKLSVESASKIADQAGKPLLNPVITYGRGSMYTQTPYTGYVNPASNTFGALVTIEGWGKRTARKGLAQADANKLNAEMIAEEKSLETEAIFSYIDALRVKLMWQSYQQAIDGLSTYKLPLAKQNIEGYQAAQKTLVNDLKYLSYNLLSYLGKPDKELPLPIGTLNITPIDFKVSELIDHALAKRADVASSDAAVKYAAANLEVVKASKNIDLTPGVYYTEVPSYSSGGFEYGSQKSISFLLSIPISNGLFNDSDVASAVNYQIQQEISMQAIQRKIIMEINQTYLQYQSARERFERANSAFEIAKVNKEGSIGAIVAYQDAQTELFDSRTILAKTMILLQRLSGNFDIPKIN